MKTKKYEKHYYIYGGCADFTLDFNGEQYTLCIDRDYDAEPPWEYTEAYFVTLYCWHRNYNLGQEHNFNCLCDCYFDLAQNDTRLTARQKKYIEKKHDDFNLSDAEFNTFMFDYLNKHSNYVIKKLYLFDHGELAISTKDFHDRWDSGGVGIAVISKDTLLCVGEINENTKNWRKKARELIDDEVEAYNTYLHGDIYIYNLYDENEELLEGNGGFWGDDIFENGILNNLCDWVDIDGLGEAWQQYFEKLADGGEK